MCLPYHAALMIVMAGLVPAIQALVIACLKDVDARHKAGHDSVGQQQIRI
jgi:hypothetical protein